MLHRASERPFLFILAPVAGRRKRRGLETLLDMMVLHCLFIMNIGYGGRKHKLFIVAIVKNDTFPYIS